MDFNKLSVGDKVMAGSGLLLFIFSFFPWYKVDFGGPFGGGTVTQSGWHFFFTGILPTLLALALVGYVVVTKVLDGTTLPELPVGWPLVVLGTAGLAALLVIIRLLVGGDDGGTGVLDRSFGIFLAVLAAIGLAAGAFLKFQEDGGEFSTKGGSSQGGASQGGSSSGTANPF